MHKQKGRSDGVFGASEAAETANKVASASSRYFGPHRQDADATLVPRDDEADLGPAAGRIHQLKNVPLLGVVIEGTKAADIQGLPAPGLVRTVTRADDYDVWMREFLGGKG